MKKQLYIFLAAVVMITFPLFLGWVPLFGEFVPKLLILLYVVLFAPVLMKNKAFQFLLLFYLYVILQSLIFGYGFDFVSWFATFMDFALPIFLLQAAIVYDNDKSERKLALFSFVFIFVTIILSILVMIKDPFAMRHQQALVVDGDMAAAAVYKRQGLASYGFAAMIMCMPAVLIHIIKTASYKNTKTKTLSIIGIVLCLIFMWLGQVTTTLVICVSLAILSFFVITSLSKGVFVGAAFFILFLALFGGPLIDAVAPYTEGTAMEAKFNNFSSNIHFGQDETEEGSIEGRTALTALTLKVFFENPIFGDPKGYIGGHNYFIDRFALYGLIGVIPFFLMLVWCYKMIIRYLPEDKHTIYNIIFIGFITLGLLKNMSKMEYWLFLFCLYPFILKYSSHLSRKSK